MMRTFLPVYFLVTMFTVFLLRTFLVRQRTGVDPIAEKWKDDVRGYIARWLVLLELMVAANVTLFAFDAGAYQWLLPFERLTGSAVQITAALVLTASTLWVAVAQIQMGDSWRIGIDPDAKTELVAHGVFGLSRNPIFLGMRVMLLGLFLASPNVLTLLIAVVGDVLIQVQVRIEEQYLESVHADRYLLYKGEVPRWLLRREPQTG
jgi:protein-S-isoprenylcysteine O-methyltransferase Ste14